MYLKQHFEKEEQTWGREPCHTGRATKQQAGQSARPLASSSSMLRALPLKRQMATVKI